jgi:hypothetical protein
VFVVDKSKCNTHGHTSHAVCLTVSDDNTNVKWIIDIDAILKSITIHMDSIFALNWFNDQMAIAQFGIAQGDQLSVLFPAAECPPTLCVLGSYQDVLYALYRPDVELGI